MGEQAAHGVRKQASALEGLGSANSKSFEEVPAETREST